jgi:hypothetical protein
VKKIIIVILILIVVIFLAKDWIVKTTVASGIRAITGLGLTAKSMRVGIFKSRLDIEELKIFNSADFTERLMLDMPKIYLDYDLVSFLKGKVHLRQLELNLKEFIVVKNAKGSLNLDSLKALQPKKGGEMPKIQIDRLDLDLGKVIYKDFSTGARPAVTEFDLNIHQRYENITDPAALVGFIVTRALANTTISELANFKFESLGAGFKNTLGKTTPKIQEAVKAGQALEEVAGKLDKIFSGQ